MRDGLRSLWGPGGNPLRPMDEARPKVAPAVAKAVIRHEGREAAWLERPVGRVAT